MRGVGRWRKLGLLMLIGSGAALAQAVAHMPLLPSGVAYDAAGNLYIADTNRQQVLESSVGGVLSVVAGTGVQGFGGDGGPATAAMLDSPQGIAVGGDGTIYVADTGNQRVRAINPLGVITTVAGTGVRGFAGDGGPAANALLRTPLAVAVDQSGALLIADSGNQRVRRVNGGIITTFAGTGVQGFAGDGAAAVVAELDTPAGVAVMADGRVVIADSHNQRLRVVALDGTITTFAGTGVAGFSGDGGPATVAKLSLPSGVAALPDGSVVFADSDNQRLREVSAAGVISTIAGSGVQGASADANAGLQASLNTPRGVAMSSFGAAVFADTANRMVRVLVDGDALYAPAGLSGPRVSTVTLSASAPVYGALTMTAAVAGVVGTPKGSVQLTDGGSVLATSVLNNGSTVFALPMLSAGPHVFVAAYGGDGLNPAAVSAAQPLTLSQAASVTSLQVAGQSYAGLPISLLAKVASATQGTPTGSVVFRDGSNVVATAMLAAGVASAVWLTPGAGTHSLVAAYGGDANFLGSQSLGSPVTVGTMPDFIVASSGSSSQTVQVGTIATFTFAVSAQPGPFTGAVSMSASGLPAGVVVSFSPVQVVPGTTSAAVTMSFPTATLLGRREVVEKRFFFAMIAPLLLLGVRRKRRGATQFGAMVVCLLLLNACGTRTAPESAANRRAYTVTVTGTGTNLAGAVVSHSTTVALTVE